MTCSFCSPFLGSRMPGILNLALISSICGFSACILRIDFMLASFIDLVITGFALKFPNSWIAEMLGNGNGEKLRGLVHRIAGVILIGAGIYHLFYLAMSREGRRLIRDVAPRPRDAFDAWGTMSYYLGLSKARPQFGRF